MHTLTIISLAGVLASSTLALLFVHSMTSELRRVLSIERRAFFILPDLPRILREHRRRFPVSESMLGLWLSLIYLMISVSCVVYCTVAHL
jgi:hypothetical protein